MKEGVERMGTITVTRREERKEWEERGRTTEDGRTVVGRYSVGDEMLKQSYSR